MALNLQNLIVPTSEQARENGRKGGKASAEAKKRRKAMKEQLEMLLSLSLKNEDVKKKIKDLGVNVEDIDNQLAINLSLMNKALKGDVQAYQVIRDTIGEKPKDKIEHSGSISYENLINEIKEK